MYALPRNVDQKPASFRLPPQIALEGSISPPLHTPVYMDIYTFLERYRCRPSIQVVTDFVAAHTVAYDTPNWRQLTRPNSTKILANYLENYLHKNSCPLWSMTLRRQKLYKTHTFIYCGEEEFTLFQMQKKLEFRIEVGRRALRHAEHAVRRVGTRGFRFILIYFQFYFHVFKVYFPEL